MTTTHTDPQTILKSFEKLRADQKRIEAQIETKELLAARQQDKELVKLTSSYTAESIFQSLAKLQSAFGQSVQELSKTMTIETNKLAQMQRAILVETQRLESLQNISVAAEALNIFEQDHRKTLQSLEEDYQQKQELLDKEIIKQREVWAKQQGEYDNAKTKQRNLQDKARLTEEEEYGYKFKRKQTEEFDAYEQRKHTIERELADEQREREKNWGERENQLAKYQTQFDEYKIKIEAIPKEIEEAMKAARDEAIKDTYKEEETKASLLAKEMEAKRKAFELKIESLTNIINQQKDQIIQLTDQLQAASNQAQQLAITAVSSSAGPIKSGEKNQ